MKQSTKPKRVNSAPGAKLSQVRLVHRDASEFNGGNQNTLQAKTSTTLHRSGKVDNELPRGLECGPYGNGMKHGLTNIPAIKWTCPPKFDLKFNWQVAAGEESEEFFAQKWRVQRIRAVLAAYPCHSAIPPCPPDLRKLELRDYDDSQTPIIPLEAADDASSPLAAQPKTPPDSEILASGTQAAASAAFTAFMECNGNGRTKPPKTSEPMLVDRKPNISEKEFKPTSSILASWARIVSPPVRSLKLESSDPLSSTDIYMTTSLPILKPARFSSSTLADRFPDLFQPTLSKQASQADTGSVSMPMKVESSVPLSNTCIDKTCSKPSTISWPMLADKNPNHSVNGLKSSLSLPAYRADMVSLPASGDSYSTRNQVQLADRMMPFQAAVASKSVQSNANLAVAAMEAKPVKDTSYIRIRKLIKQYGTQKQEARRRTFSQTGSHFNQTPNLKLAEELNPGARINKFGKACISPNAKRTKF